MRVFRVRHWWSWPQPFRFLASHRRSSTRGLLVASARALARKPRAVQRHCRIAPAWSSPSFSSVPPPRVRWGRVAMRRAPRNNLESHPGKLAGESFWRRTSGTPSTCACPYPSVLHTTRCPGREQPPFRCRAAERTALFCLGFVFARLLRTPLSACAAGARRAR